MPRQIDNRQPFAHDSTSSGTLVDAPKVEYAQSQVEQCNWRRLPLQVGESCRDPLYQQGGIGAAWQFEGQHKLMAAGVEFIRGVFVADLCGHENGGPVAARKEHFLETFEFQLLLLQPFFFQDCIQDLKPRISRIEIDSAGRQRKLQEGQFFSQWLGQSAIHGNIAQAQVDGKQKTLFKMGSEPASQHAVPQVTLVG